VCDADAIGAPSILRLIQNPCTERKYLSSDWNQGTSLVLLITFLLSEVKTEIRYPLHVDI
jgi:hypothetical protein